jgi:hypothetical protein
MKNFKIVTKHDDRFNQEIFMYILLVVGLGLFVGLAYLFRFNPYIQALIFFGASTFYALWGIIHHYIEDRLSNAVVAEYLLFAFIVFLLALLSTGAYSI